MWSKRDTVVEDEILNDGRFADTVFICAASSTPDKVEEVYGHAALFALISPVLRERLNLSLNDTAPEIVERPVDNSGLSRDACGRQKVWLADEITARGFREVARYVYRLAPKFTAVNISEVSVAARILQLPELDKAAFEWGLENLQIRASQRGCQPPEVSAREGEEGPYGPIGDALCYFGMMCSPVGDIISSDLPRQDAAIRWRDVLLKAFDVEEIAASPAFQEVREGAMLLLLECEEIHTEPALLWERCVRWALGRKEREPPPARLTRSIDKFPKKLFAPGARLFTVAAPEPADCDVDWQRWLLPVAERMRFQDMSPRAFAAQMEAIQPMLPELRQVIYKVRRHGTSLDATRRLCCEAKAAA